MSKGSTSGRNLAGRAGMGTTLSVAIIMLPSIIFVIVITCNTTWAAAVNVVIIEALFG